LKWAAARRVRRFSIGNLRNMAQSRMGEIIEQQRARAARMDNPSRKQVPQRREGAKFTFQ
jgi:hypothetical protein